MMLLPLVAIPALVYLSGYLALIVFRSRLPCREVKVVKTRLAAVYNSQRQRFVVKFHPPAPKGRMIADEFWYVLPTDLQNGIGSRKYDELNGFYRIGRTIRLYYVPHLEWAFAQIPESPSLPPGTTMLSVIVIVIATVLGFWYWWRP